MIRTVTGDVEAISGRILAHEHLQIDLSAQKGPANKVGAAKKTPSSRICVAAQGIRPCRHHRPQRAALGTRSRRRCAGSASAPA